VSLSLWFGNKRIRLSRIHVEWRGLFTVQQKVNVIDRSDRITGPTPAKLYSMILASASFYLFLRQELILEEYKRYGRELELAARSRSSLSSHSHSFLPLQFLNRAGPYEQKLQSNSPLAA
jgi:hypothetical protein